jgi:thioredoxin 1
MNRKAFLCSLVGLTLSATSSWAAQQKTFTLSDLQTAQDSGQTVVVDVSAPWCSTCKAQAPIVQALLNEPKYKNLLLLHVDFDTQKAVLRQLNVREQSTFVAFKGKQEVGRSSGDTNKTSIEGLFDKAL